MMRWILAGALALFAFTTPTIALSPAQINGCQYLASPPTLSNQQTSVIQCDSSGNLKTSGGGSGSNASVGPTSSPVPGSATYIGGIVGGTLQGAAIDGASGGLITHIDTSQVITSGTAAAPSTQLLSVTLVPAVGLGCAPYHFVTTASTNSQSIKAAAAGTLCDIQVFNTSTTISYFRLYDAAAAPTCSSGTGAIKSWPVPPASATGGVGGYSIPIPYGIAFANGIGYCVTGGGSDTDNTNGQANIYVNVDYK